MSAPKRIIDQEARKDIIMRSKINIIINEDHREKKETMMVEYGNRSKSRERLSYQKEYSFDHKKSRVRSASEEKDYMNSRVRNRSPSSERYVIPARRNECSEINTSSVIKTKARISSPERWEINQMIAAKVIDKSELPEFDEETGLLPKADSDDEDIEIELVEEEAPFLKGQGNARNDLSPVRIVKNPDGSLAQAAMMAGALSKERREQKMKERQENEGNNTEKCTVKSWQDPFANVPEGFSATKSNEVKSHFDKLMSDMPEWKRHIIGGSKGSYGKIRAFNHRAKGVLTYL